MSTRAATAETVHNASSNTTSSWFFEDYVVGDVIDSDPVTFDRAGAAAYLEAVGGRVPLHDPTVEEATAYGPHIIAKFMDWVARAGMATHIIAEMRHSWDFSQPVPFDATVIFRMTPTRAVRTRSGTRGIIDRAIEVVSEDGTVLQTATSRILVDARGDADSIGDAGVAFSEPSWVEALTAALNNNDAFRQCTSSWDGSIGLTFGPDTVQLRVYKGKVIDSGTRTPHGPTFTLALSEKNWAQLLTGEYNDFTERAMRGQTRTTGNAYEYIRHTRTIMVIVDAMRSIIHEGNS